MFTKYLAYYGRLPRIYAYFQKLPDFFRAATHFYAANHPLRTDLHDKAAQQWTFSLSLRPVQKQDHMRIPTKQKAWETNETRLRVQKAEELLPHSMQAWRRTRLQTTLEEQVRQAGQSIAPTCGAQCDTQAQPHSPILRQYRRQCREQQQ